MVGASIISRFLWLACWSSRYPRLLALLPVGRCNEGPAPKILARGQGGRRRTHEYATRHQERRRKEKEKGREEQRPGRRRRGFDSRCCRPGSWIFFPPLFLLNNQISRVGPWISSRGMNVTELQRAGFGRALSLPIDISVAVINASLNNKTKH